MHNRELLKWPRFGNITDILFPTDNLYLPRARHVELILLLSNSLISPPVVSPLCASLIDSSRNAYRNAHILLAEEYHVR